MSWGDAFIEIEAERKSKKREPIEEKLEKSFPELSRYERLCKYLKTSEVHGDYYGTCKSKARVSVSPPDEQDRTCPAFHHYLMVSYVNSNEIYECPLRKERK